MTEYILRYIICGHYADGSTGKPLAEATALRLYRYQGWQEKEILAQCRACRGPAPRLSPANRNKPYEELP